uniref:NADH:ubiquinone reductase (H(+)-translocating) n=1 Tax=Ciona savignyi TaxID=51511 RepID=Q85UI2_CIOSA|nr:NADH dehydrogenase subunit 5 [Ciona savignyi]BAC57001.1 NADH dehydrogenase subunit 5 [Ciona savignyi]
MMVGIVKLILIYLPFLMSSILFNKSLVNMKSMKINSFMFLMFSLLLFLNSNNGVSMIGMGWMNMKFVLSWDFYSIVFIFIGMSVTWSILNFAQWYMGAEVKNGTFNSFLFLFLMFMFILTSSVNLVFLLIGWEGVGIMSFLLINWWFGRGEAGLSGIQAMVYNRIGDFFIYIGIFFFLSSLSEVVMLSFFFNMEYMVNNLILIFLLIGMMAKSSLFFFQPWLPNAMEGPTPVSALLHSSTMVVAGVYLMCRLVGMFNLTVLGVVGLIGALTMLYGSVCALMQPDMKKIIAHSTTSQLGLMVVTLGFGYPFISFLHMGMHAYIKSLIFISSGVFIHGTMNLQDFRKMKMGSISSKFSMYCMFFCSLSLGGFPFLAGFYSKDSILENMYGSFLNSFLSLVVILGSVMTVVYSFKLMYLVLFFNNNDGSFSVKLEGQESFNSTFFFMSRLFLGGISGGFFFMWSIFLVMGEEYISWYLKVIPLMILFFGLLVGLILVPSKMLVAPVFNLLYYNPVVHRITLFMFYRSIKIMKYIEFFGMEILWVSHLKKIPLLSSLFNGFVTYKNYFFFCIVGLLLLMFLF